MYHNKMISILRPCSANSKIRYFFEKLILILLSEMEPKCLWFKPQRAFFDKLFFFFCYLPIESRCR